MSKKQLVSISVLIVLLLIFVTGKLRTQKKTFRLTPTTSVIENNIEKTTYAQNPLYYLSSETSPNGLYRIDSFSGDYSDRYNYYQIFVTNLETDKTKRLYSSDFRTTDWKWTPDNKVKVTYNCGTGCKATKIIGVDQRIAISEEKQGMITEANGWKVEFFKSF